MVPVMLTFYNTGLKTVKERSNSRVCINSKEHENVMSFRRHVIGPPWVLGIWGEWLFIIPRQSRRDIFGVARASVRPFRPSVHTFCLSGTICQYLKVRFDSFLVQMISTMDCRYPIGLVKIDSLTLELLPLF